MEAGYCLTRAGRQEASQGRVFTLTRWPTIRKGLTGKSTGQRFQQRQKAMGISGSVRHLWAGGRGQDLFQEAVSQKKFHRSLPRTHFWRRRPEPPENPPAISSTPNVGSLPPRVIDTALRKRSWSHPWGMGFHTEWTTKKGPQPPSPSRRTKSSSSSTVTPSSCAFRSLDPGDSPATR